MRCYNLVWLWYVPVDVKIPGGRRNLHLHPVHVTGDRDLAPQPAGFRQPIGHVQHVLLVLGCFVQFVKGVLVGDNHVAGATGADALAGALQLDVVPLGDLQERFSDVGIDIGLERVTVDVQKRNVDRIGVVVVDVGTTVPSLLDSSGGKKILFGNWF